MPKASSVKSTSSSVSLPDISSLLRESWSNFTATVWSFIAVGLIEIVIFILGAVVLVLVGFLAAGLLGLNAQALSQSISGGQGLSVLQGATLGIIVLIVLCILGFFYLSASFTAALILVIGGNQEKNKIGKAISSGFSRAIPTIGTMLITYFLLTGSFFLFIIPVLIFYVLLGFSTLETILSHNSPLVSIRNSVSMGRQHFWELLGRFLLLVLPYMFFRLLLSSAITQTSGGTKFFLELINFVISIGFSAFSLSYMVTLYKQTKAATKKQVSSRWVWIVAVLGWALFTFLIVAVGQTALDSIQKLQQAKTGQTALTEVQLGTSIEKSNTFAVASEIFSRINFARTEQKLKPFILDDRLCAYAQRRLGQLKDFGGYDDRKGFIEDIANREIDQAYFSKFKTMNEVLYSLKGDKIYPKNVMETWLTAESSPDYKNKVVLSPAFTHACVRSNDQFVVMIAAH